MIRMTAGPERLSTARTPATRGVAPERGHGGSDQREEPVAVLDRHSAEEADHLRQLRLDGDGKLIERGLRARDAAAADGHQLAGLGGEQFRVDFRERLAHGGVDLHHDDERRSSDLTHLEPAHGSLAHTRQARELLLRETDELPQAARVAPHAKHPSFPVDRRPCAGYLAATAHEDGFFNERRPCRRAPGEQRGEKRRADRVAQSDLPLNARALFTPTPAFEYVASKHVPPDDCSWTRAGRGSGSTGGPRCASCPLRLAFAAPAGPDRSVAAVVPSGRPSLLRYRNPVDPAGLHDAPAGTLLS